MLINREQCLCIIYQLTSSSRADGKELHRDYWLKIYFFSLPCKADWYEIVTSFLWSIFIANYLMQPWDGFVNSFKCLSYLFNIPMERFYILARWRHTFLTTDRVFIFHCLTSNLKCVPKQFRLYSTETWLNWRILMNAFHFSSHIK